MPAPPSLAVNPFVGPQPFQIGQPLFGREREITELRYLLTSERIVLLSLCDVRTAKPLQAFQFPSQNGLTAVGSSPDSRIVAISGPKVRSNWTVAVDPQKSAARPASPLRNKRSDTELYDAASRKQMTALPIANAVALSATPDNKLLATSDQNGTLLPDAGPYRRTCTVPDL